jgi:hypothetical protein
MAITMQDPNTIHLGGPVTIENTRAASEVIYPGHLVLLFNNGGIQRYKKHDGTSLAAVRAVALDQPDQNLPYTTPCAANDLIPVGIGAPGCKFWMHIASGQTIVAGDKLESNGDGTLKIYSAGIALFAALENKTAVADTMIRVEVI